MTVKILSRLRVALLILIGLSAIAGLFPGLMLWLIGQDHVDASTDVFLLIGFFYFMIFVLAIVWVMLAVLERRLKGEDSKTLEE